MPRAVESTSQDEARAQFRQADTDASGTISPAEWRAWREQISVRAIGAAGDQARSAGDAVGEHGELRASAP